jgi:competence protein ComEA
MFDFFRLRHSDQRTVALVLTISAVLLCWHTARGKQEIFEPKQYKFRIDLNTATCGELQTLPGIGPKLAESIIQYRDQHAPIDDFDEILNVRGIGIKRHSTMKPYFAE